MRRSTRFPPRAPRPARASRTRAVPDWLIRADGLKRALKRMPGGKKRQAAAAVFYSPSPYNSSPATFAYEYHAEGASRYTRG